MAHLVLSRPYASNGAIASFGFVDSTPPPNVPAWHDLMLPLVWLRCSPERSQGRQARTPTAHATRGELSEEGQKQRTGRNTAVYIPWADARLMPAAGRHVQVGAADVWRRQPVVNDW